MIIIIMIIVMIISALQCHIARPSGFDIRWSRCYLNIIHQQSHPAFPSSNPVLFRFSSKTKTSKNSHCSGLNVNEGAKVSTTIQHGTVTGLHVGLTPLGHEQRSVELGQGLDHPHWGGIQIFSPLMTWVWVKIQDLGDHRHSQLLVFTIQLFTQFRPIPMYLSYSMRSKTNPHFTVKTPPQVRWWGGAALPEGRARAGASRSRAAQGRRRGDVSWSSHVDSYLGKL